MSCQIFLMEIIFPIHGRIATSEGSCKQDKEGSLSNTYQQCQVLSVG